ncbi:MAG: hypothetical protein H0T71_11175 [Acidobacteria bacterium]|nr:hypothetical protein [Acidobacteriota bacterium]
MSLDPSMLFVSIIVGSIGLALFLYGKKQARMPHLAIGLALMLYPYFTSTLRPMLLIGALLLFALWWVVRLGW